MEISTQTTQPSALISTLRSASLEEVYGEALKWQRWAAARSVSGVFDRWPVWRASSHILDVGCGDGAFALEHQATIFNEKTYFGIDLQEALIHQARQTLPPSRFAFRTADVYGDLGGSFDAALLNGTLQYLKEPGRALDSIAKVVTKAIVVFDGNNRGPYGYEAWPPLPSLQKHFDVMSLKYKKLKSSTETPRVIHEWAARSGWRVTFDEDFTIELNSPKERELHYLASMYFEAFLEKDSDVSPNYESLSAELQSWLQTPDSWIKLHGVGRWIVLEAA